MKFPVLLSLLSITTPIFANSNIKEGIVPKWGCTKDRNYWNNPSVCRCPYDFFYAQQVKRCLSHAMNPSIFVQGVIDSGVVAIGGETTGIILTTYDAKSYELIVHPKYLEKLNMVGAQFFEVSGVPVTFNYLERGEVSALIVNEIRWLN